MPEVYLQPLFAPDILGDAEPGGVAITHFPFLMGRHPDCNYCINNSLISRHHCVFYLQNGQVFVQDLGSLNGTKLNAQPLRSPQPVHDGDELCLFFLSFVVQVPVQPDAPAVESEDTDLDMNQSAEARRVLLVEDNESTAKALALLMADWGHQVHVAHDGHEALEAAQAHHPDVVLLDIRLPGMDGYQLAQRLRGQRALKHAHLVALTGYPVEEDNDRSRKVGISRLLTKPVKSAALREALSQAH